jgi:hypothetical protein
MTIPSWQNSVNLPWRDEYAVPAEEYTAVITVSVAGTGFNVGFILRISAN